MSSYTEETIFNDYKIVTYHKHATLMEPPKLIRTLNIEHIYSGLIQSKKENKSIRIGYHYSGWLYILKKNSENEICLYTLKIPNSKIFDFIAKKSPDEILEFSISNDYVENMIKYEVFCLGK